MRIEILQALMLMWVAGVAFAATPVISTEAEKVAAAKDRADHIEAGVEKLIAEANELEVVEDPKVRAHLSRPNPAVSTWEGTLAVDVLDRMLKRFTGNPYRDTYIRWHLMHVVKKVPPEQQEQIGSRLIKLIQKMPDPLQVALMIEHRNEPPDVAGRYYQLRGSTHVRVGYPPFQMDYWGRDSLPHVNEKRKAEIEKALMEMQGLQWKRVNYSGAVAFNARVRKVNWIIRQYRGELIYEMLRTGDPKMISLVVNEIDRQVKAKQRVAFDLMSFMYLAAFDGHLEKYDDKILLDLSRRLENIARGAGGYLVYRTGGEDPPSYDHMRNRNFADYAFHMVYMLRHVQMVSGSSANLPDPPDPSDTPDSTQKQSPGESK